MNRQKQEYMRFSDDDLKPGERVMCGIIVLILGWGAYCVAILIMCLGGE